MLISRDDRAHCACASAPFPPAGRYGTCDPRAGGSGGLASLNFAGKPLQSALLDQLVSSHVRDCCVRNRLRRRPRAPERYDSGGGVGARSASQACCSSPTPRSVTTCRSLQIRPIISPI